MNQKYYAEHKEKKFAGKEKFDKWLKENAVKKICFKDKGQDCLEWWIDKGGEVLHSWMQSFVWNGCIVDLNWLKIGNNIGIMNPAKMQTDFTDFEIEKIIDLKE